jgi:hypothetical protein
MATTVTVSTSAASSVTIKPSKSTVSSVVVAPASNISLSQLKDLDVANITDGQALVYNSANGKYEGSTITAGAVTQLTGGKF